MQDQKLEVHVGMLDEIPEDACVLVHVEDRVIGVIKKDGRVYAYENRCLHQGGPVCQGEVLGRCEAVVADDRSIVEERLSATEKHLVCPWHGWEYNLETGRCVTDPAMVLQSYETAVRGDDVYVYA